MYLGLQKRLNDVILFDNTRRRTNNDDVKPMYSTYSILDRNRSKRSVQVEIRGVPLSFIIDTESDWRTLKQVGFAAYSVRKGSSKVFKAYGSSSPLTVLGEVDTDVKINRFPSIKDNTQIEDSSTVSFKRMNEDYISD